MLITDVTLAWWEGQVKVFRLRPTEQMTSHEPVRTKKAVHMRLIIISLFGSFKTWKSHYIYSCTATEHLHTSMEVMEKHF